MAKQQGSIQHLYETSAWFAANNPVLLPGQLGIEIDTITANDINIKCGDNQETPYIDLPYAFDARFKALEDRITTGYFAVLPTDPGITIDTLGRVNYQNDLLKSKTNYLVEPLQLNAKFSMVNGVDLLYKPTTGGFTILKEGFVLDATYGLIIWVNSKISGSAGGGDTSGLQLQLDNHEERIAALEAGGGNPVPLILDVTVDGQSQFNIFKAPSSLSYLVINGSEYFENEDYTISTNAGNVTLTWLNIPFTLSTSDNIKLFKN